MNGGDLAAIVFLVILGLLFAGGFLVFGLSLLWRFAVDKWTGRSNYGIEHDAGAAILGVLMLIGSGLLLGLIAGAVNGFGGGA